jgi:hypothetical protein
VGDSTKIALVVDALRGGNIAFDVERELAAALPGVRRMVTWADRFSARAAELAVLGGIGSVLICGTGFPVRGDAPHRLAAAASPAARFGYPSTSPVVAALRQLALDGDPRAVAFRATIANPAQMVRRAAMAGLAGPLQVQWGIGSWRLGAEDGAALAAAHAEALPAGSQVAMSAAERAGEVGVLAGDEMFGHSPEVLAGWAAGAGLDVVLEVPDVRAWDRGGWGDVLRRDWPAGRVSGLVAVKPLFSQGRVRTRARRGKPMLRACSRRLARRMPSAMPDCRPASHAFFRSAMTLSRRPLRCAAA